MKRIADLPIIIGLMIMICAILLSARITACAEEDYFSSDTDKLIDSLYSESGADDLMPALPDSTKDFLGRLYIDDFKPDSAEKLSLSSIISAVTYAVRENMIEPLRLAICIMGIILLTALFDTLKTSEFSAGLEQTLSFVSLICVSAVISPQIFSLITELTDTITACSDFMIIYIPVITILIIAGGKIISGGMFYSTMIYMSSGMMRVVSEIVVPVFVGDFRDVQKGSKNTSHLLYVGFYGVSFYEICHQRFSGYSFRPSDKIHCQQLCSYCRGSAERCLSDRGELYGGAEVRCRSSCRDSRVCCVRSCRIKVHDMGACSYGLHRRLRCVFKQQAVVFAEFLFGCNIRYMLDLAFGYGDIRYQYGYYSDRGWLSGEG